MDGLQEDTGDGSMFCTEHPFKNNTPAGGICAFCLQEKLGKLVSSSFPIAVFPSSSSSSPSFRSDTVVTTTTTTVPPRLTNSNSTSLLGSNNNNNNNLNTRINPNECHYQDHHSNGSRILYLLGQKKKKKKDLNILSDGVHGTDRNNNLVFKRSKSTVAPRRGGGSMHYMDADTPHKRGFWSFLYLQKHPNTSSSSFNRNTLTDISSNSMRAPVTSSFSTIQQNSNNNNMNNMIVVEENGSPCHATFDRKVSRSRSVGCGSRSFSGDFFERISTGFGDCTLRRVESQREGKVKVSTMRSNNGQDCIQERVRCGGLFSGFMITSSSSSSSSSSNWVGSNINNNNNNNTNEGNVTGKVTSAVAGTGQHSRSKSWGWALASPMRAFSKQTSSSKKKNSNPTPNLNAIPSLLSVGS